MTKQWYFIIFIVFISLSCGKKLMSYSNKRNIVIAYTGLNDSTLLLSGVSDDLDFGFSEKNPVMLGMIDVHAAAENIEKYLNALKGPNGESITYNREKPCCPFKTKNFTYTVNELGLTFDYKHGMLEKYSVKYISNSRIYRNILFFNLYDETRRLLAPHGYTFQVR